MNFPELLSSLGYPADAVPPAIMQAAGWSPLATFSFRGVESPDVAAVSASIDKAILSVFPDTVRLTVDQREESLSLWRHPNPPPVTVEAFPAPLDVAHALRVIQAVGIARASELADRRDAAAAAQASDAEVARLTDQLNAEQALFEHIASILERHRSHDGH